jgi:hypothetical protein
MSEFYCNKCRLFLPLVMLASRSADGRVKTCKGCKDRINARTQTNDFARKVVIDGDVYQLCTKV